MELLYLLCSIISTTITSLILSFLLPFRRRICSPKFTDGSIALYEGTVYHERRRPVHHSFRYSVRYALIDLDASVNAQSDHFSPDEARRLADTNGPVYLLTIPRSVGYDQNPLSVYYCYDIEGSCRTLKKCIAEVTNTPWGERVTFLFNPESDLVAKPLHVSPFMDMHGNWSMKANEPGDNLHIVISVQHPKLGNYFTASLTAKRVDSSLSEDHSAFFWLMPHKVALWIYWHSILYWMILLSNFGGKMLHLFNIRDIVLPHTEKTPHDVMQISHVCHVEAWKPAVLKLKDVHLSRPPKCHLIAASHGGMLHGHGAEFSARSCSASILKPTLVTQPKLDILLKLGIAVLGF